MRKFIDTQQTPARFNEQNKNDGKGWFRKEKYAERPFRSFSFIDLTKKIHAHRMGMSVRVPVDLEAGWLDRLEDEMCEEGSHDRECVDRDNPGPWKSQLEKEGRKLWLELHEYALKYPKQPSDVVINLAKDWLRKWEERIPNFGCGCRRSYEDLKKEFLPSFKSRKDFYLWTVEIHQRVSSKIRHEAPAWQVPDEVLALLE